MGAAVVAFRRRAGSFSHIDDLRALPVSRPENSQSSRALTLGEVATVKCIQETEQSRAFFSERGSNFRAVASGTAGARLAPERGGCARQHGRAAAAAGAAPNRDGLSFFGISYDELASQVRIAYSSDVIGTFAASGDSDDLDIRLGMEWPSQPGEAGGPSHVEEFSRGRAYLPGGGSIAMFQLLSPTQSEEAIAISHVDGERALTVLAKNQGRTVTEIMNVMSPRLDELQQDWPAGYRIAVGGESAETADSLGSIDIAMLVAIVLMVGVLVIVFSSFHQALIIFATIPLVIIFGLISATLLVLSVVPALYYLLTPADANEPEVLD